MGGHRHVMVALSPGKRPIVQKDSSALGLVWTKAESLAPTRFEPRTVRSLTNRYIEYAIPVHELCDKIKKYRSETVIDFIDNKSLQWTLVRI